MDCIINVEIPIPLVEKCSGNYINSDCIVIPEANVTLDLSIGASQTEVNDAITSALIYKEQQIEELQAAVVFDISDYQLKNIPDDTDIASALNEGKLRYRTDANNSYVDMCMKVSINTYEWTNLVQNNWI